MRVDIWSDLVCPWCYVGKRRFERALAAFDGRDAVEIVHRSFQLNPLAPREYTTDRREMLMRKYRLSPAQVDELDARMTRTAAADGLEYHLDRTATGNTFDAHRLLQLARVNGSQETLVERFYRAYFTEWRSIFAHDPLLALAVEGGLDHDAAREVLAGDAYADAVAADIDMARQLGAGGVPFFVFDDRLSVSGAQAPDVFLDALVTRAAAAEHHAADQR